VQPAHLVAACEFRKGVLPALLSGLCGGGGKVDGISPGLTCVVVAVRVLSGVVAYSRGGGKVAAQRKRMSQKFDTEWNYGPYYKGSWERRVKLKPNPHPEDWNMHDRDFQEAARFMRRRYAELDRLIDELTDRKDFWCSLVSHQNAIDEDDVIKVHTGARGAGDFSIALISEVEVRMPITELLVVIPVSGLADISLRKLRHELGPVEERIRKAIIRRVEREQRQAERWRKSQAERRADPLLKFYDRAVPPAGLAFSARVPCEPYGSLWRETALHDYQRLLIRSLLVWMEGNAKIHVDEVIVPPAAA
jgi:hypothetical protein